MHENTTMSIANRASFNVCVNRGKNGPPDHFTPISVDRVKVLVFYRLHNLSHAGEGWSMLPVFPVGSGV